MTYLINYVNSNNFNILQILLPKFELNIKKRYNPAYFSKINIVILYNNYLLVFL
jgi:hypothetical protein